VLVASRGAWGNDVATSGSRGPDLLQRRRGAIVIRESGADGELPTCWRGGLVYHPYLSEVGLIALVIARGVYAQFFWWGGK
jgi:hypothetical protein